MAQRAKKKILQRFYHKEPFSSFLLVVGLMEGVIGGVHGQWSLFSLGLGLILGAFVVRRSQLRKARLDADRVLPRRYLPPSQIPDQPLPPLVRPAKNKRRK